MNRFNLFFVIAIVGSCASCKKTPSVLPADAAPPPSFTKSPSVDASVEIDALWRDAMREDPLALAALADREGADALVAVIDQGGTTGLAALHAVAYSHDAELALQRLGEIAFQTDDDSQEDIVEQIRRIVARPPDSRDVLDPEAIAGCALSLRAIAAKSSVRKSTRAKAVSALRMLADHKQISGADIPTDFDM